MARENDFSSGWTELTNEGGLLYAGNYYLSQDINLIETITIAGTVTIDLNGYMLKGASNGEVIYMAVRATFNLEDSNGAARTYYYTQATDSAPSTVSQSSDGAVGSFTGGVITGGNNTSGGGINAFVGDFNMYGGAVVGNAAEYNGGGVGVTGGAFTMSGGMISGNTANSGGGVYAYKPFTMSGGTISDNTANSGGGVYAYSNATFTMDGGTIAGNTANEGGGVYVGYATFFTMEGGEISGNTATSGGGVYAYSNATFTMDGGYVGFNQTSDGTTSDINKDSRGTVTITGGFFNVGGVDGNTVAGVSVAENCKVYRTEGAIWLYGVIADTAEDYPQPVEPIAITVSDEKTSIYDGYAISEGEEFTLNLSSEVTDTTGAVQSYSYMASGDGSVQSGTPKNAGAYTIIATIQLPNSIYSLCEYRFDFTIEKAQVDVAWGETSFDYDGQAHLPTAAATGVGEDGDLEVTVSGEQTNAGTYTATAAAANANYEFTNGKTEFVINKVLGTLVWGEEVEFDYNGKAQAPTATASGAYDEEIELTILGVQTNAGKYTATATSKNYYFTNDEIEFVINKVQASVVWGETELTYNGKAQAPTATIQGAGGDGDITLTVIGAQINVGKYTAIATSENHYIDNDRIEFVINKAQASVVWGETELKYNGEAQAPTATATGVNGEKIELVISGEQTKAGKYTATASTQNGNYELTNATVTYHIKSSNTAAIVGGTIGGIAAIAAGVGIGVFVIKRKKRVQ